MVAGEPYVIDASAAVEYLLGSDVGTRIEALMDGSLLIAPEMLDAEVLSALRRKVQQQEISEESALDALGRLEDMPVERVSHRTFTRAAWSLRHNFSAYDALYVALAQARRATLLTFDGPLTRGPMAGLGITVVNVGIA